MRISKGIKYFFSKALSKEIGKIKKPEHVSELKDAPVTVLAGFLDRNMDFLSMAHSLIEVLSGLKLQDLIDFCGNHLKIPLPVEISPCYFGDAG